MHRAVLFDKDGTLVDLLATWMPAYRAAAERVAALAGDPSLADRLLLAGGYLPDEDTLAAGSMLSCGSNEDIIDAWVADPAVRAPDVAATVIRDTFHERSVHHAVPLVPLRPLLAGLRARGLRLGVATMDNEAAATACLDRLGVLELLDRVIGCDSGYAVKPAPDMVLAFCASSGVAPADLVFVGDAVRDMQMAGAAGVGLKVAVLTGVADEATLAPWADVVLGSVAELPGLLDARG